MRLLRCSSNEDFELVSFANDSLPPYGILSHTWIDDEEVTYHELLARTAKHKLGFKKIKFCADRATHDGLEYFWIDTCCIDKSNQQELQTAINSMFRWYKAAKKCYVYLSDVESERDFAQSRWFTRGWTLQELLAPNIVEFFTKDGQYLGDRSFFETTVAEITAIPIDALRGQSLAQFSVRQRLSWIGERQTSIVEDRVYCLLGISGVFSPLIYGEGEAYALDRLHDEIQRRGGRVRKHEAQGRQRPVAKRKRRVAQRLEIIGNDQQQLAHWMHANLSELSRLYFSHSLQTRADTPMKSAPRYILDLDVFQTVSSGQYRGPPKSLHQLVIGPDRKNMLATLTKQTLERPKVGLFDKGAGMIFLLYGDKGTGKGATAQALASSHDRPLRLVRIQDMQLTNANVTESIFREMLKNCEDSGAILHLDEAAFLLVQRCSPDPERNAIFSTFLRVLEYYQGIVVITSSYCAQNRIHIAIMSRVDVAVHYAKVKGKEAIAIFETELQQVVSEGCVDVNMDEVMIYGPNLLGLSKKWAARSIVDIVRCGVALAVHEHATALQSTTDYCAWTQPGRPCLDVAILKRIAKARAYLKSDDDDEDDDYDNKDSA